MALNLSLSAEDLAEQNRMNEAEQMRGDVKEVSQGPERDNKPIEVAMSRVGDMTEIFKMLNDADPIFQQGVSKSGGTTTAPKVPTQQEQGLVTDPNQFSYRETQTQQAKELLTPNGQKRFREQGFQANVPEPSADDALLKEAQDALDLDPNLDAASSFVKDAQAGVRDTDLKSDKGLASEQFTDAIIDRQTRADVAIKDLAEGGDFNFNNIQTADDVKLLISNMSEELKNPSSGLSQNSMVAVTRGRKTFQEIKDDAAKLFVSEVGLSNTILRRKTGQTFNAETLTAARELLVRGSMRAEELAKKIGLGQASDTERLQFRRQLAINAGIQLQLKGAQTEAARALAAFRIQVDGSMDATKFNEAATQMLNENARLGVSFDDVKALNRKGMLQDETTLMAARYVQLAKNAKETKNMRGLYAFTQKTWGAKTKNVIHEAFLAGLLSSPSTQFKNIIGNASYMMYQLPSEVMAGLYGSVERGVKTAIGQRQKITEDQVYLTDAIHRTQGWMAAMDDAWSAAVTAWKTEQPTGKSKLDLETYTASDPENMGMVKTSRLVNGLDWSTKTLRWPLRLLLSVDEFTKTVVQRGELHTAAHRRFNASLREGKPRESALDDAMMVMLDPRSVGDELNLKGLNDTLQSDLGLLGKAGQIAQRNFFGRFIMPFLTAPTNDVLRTIENLPVVGQAKTIINQLRGFTKNGRPVPPKVRQEAIGRFAVGGFVFAKVKEASTDGKLTGAMPRSQKIRDRLPPGWQPYSFAIRGDNWPTDSNGEPLPLFDQYHRPNGAINYISYAGYGPVSAMLAIASNTAQRQTLISDSGIATNTMTAAMLSSMEYFSELPMLQGLQDVFQVFKDPSMETLVGLSRSQVGAGTAIPYFGAFVPNYLSSMQRAVQRGRDPKKITPRIDELKITKQMVDETTYEENGVIKYQYSIPGSNGQIPNYNMIGMTDETYQQVLSRVDQQIRALQEQDSFIKDEYDRNAVIHDVYGNEVGEDALSVEANGMQAMVFSLVGVKLSPGQKLTDVEMEMTRLAAVSASGIPLINPKEIYGVGLSKGAQSDLARYSKGFVDTNQDGQNDAATIRVGSKQMTFKEALEYTIDSSYYQGLSDENRHSTIKAINRKFIEEGYELMLDNDFTGRYANLYQAIEDKKKYTEELSDDRIPPSKTLKKLRIR